MRMRNKLMKIIKGKRLKFISVNIYFLTFFIVAKTFDLSISKSDTITSGIIKSVE